MTNTERALKIGRFMIRVRETRSNKLVKRQSRAWNRYLSTGSDRSRATAADAYDKLMGKFMADKILMQEQDYWLHKI